MDIKFFIPISLIIQWSIHSSNLIPGPMKIIGHEIKLRKNGSNLLHLDIRNVIRITRKSGRQTVHFPGCSCQHFQRVLDGGEHLCEIFLVGGCAAVVFVARILPVNINSIKIMIGQYIHAILRECVPRGSVGTQCGKVVAQCPPSNRRINLSTLLMRLINQPSLMLMIRTIHLARPIVTALLHPPSNFTRIRPEQQLRIAPSIRPKDIPQSIRLKEGVVDALDLFEVHVGWFGEFVAVVPLPAGVVSDYFFGGSVGGGGGGVG
mmetsp:Transcript_12123/g.21569  ORF Transcript_12123/g.21569 Transcript_12123/m.21569 type:complete len:263 (-) Transcript_12123:1095-1883(-)